MGMPQFYNLNEAATKLGRSEDDVKALVRDGKLREFRDRGQLFFKTDEVDRLVEETGRTDDSISLDDSSVGGLALNDDSGLGDSALGDSDVGASTAGGTGLSDSGLGDSGLSDSAIGASHAGTPAKIPDAKTLEGEGSSLGEYDLAGDSGPGLSGSSLDLSPAIDGASPEAAEDEIPDIGLSGSGELSLDDDEEVLAKAADKGDTVITSVGISVFDDDEIEIDVDPLAKTQVTPSIEDQISLEGVGSGSGLLDLTREADDTSLGAELLDEIYPGEEESTMQEDLPTEVLPGVAETVGAGAPSFAPGAAPQQWVLAAPAPPDPAAAGFTGMMIVSVLMLCLTGTVLAAAVQGVVPSFLATLYEQWLFVAIGGIALAFICLGVGWFMGRPSSGAPKPTKARAKAEAKAEEKAAEQPELVVDDGK
ncbi:MAG: helix-turn-helix domain-containing protein [Phycisphaerae bacterium]|nr:helix-turn-helix domain-containing protein [Phycisphaerae bacterium]